MITRAFKLLKYASILTPVFIFPIIVAQTAQAQYTVIPDGSLIRGSLWIGDGIAGVFSSNRYVANRFRIGGEIHLGEDYEFILGWNFFDLLSSGETSPSAGSISRRSSDLSVGYFIIPDKLSILYSLQFQDISGSSVIGDVIVLGHQISVGYRFYSSSLFNLAVEGAYLFVSSSISTTYNYSTSTIGSVTFPAANIWSLNFRVGYDIGGR